MKKLLILGWASARNQEYVRQLSEYAVWQGFTSYAFEYDHWSTWETQLDRECEIEKLKALSLKDVDLVIAKSMGTGLVAQLLNDRLDSENVKVLFLWVPLRVSKELWFEVYYKTIQNLTIVQNEFDPTGSYQMISDYFSSHHKVDVVCVKEKTSHDYWDFEDYLSLLLEK